MRMTEEQYQSHLRKSTSRSTKLSSLPHGNATTSELSAKPKRSKYLNVKTTDHKGRVHDSGKECRRGQELELRERAGEISDLRRQVKLELIPAQKVDGKLVERRVYWRADFVYKEDGVEIWEDVKGVRTASYILKRKMALYLRGVRIRET